MSEEENKINIEDKKRGDAVMGVLLMSIGVIISAGLALFAGDIAVMAIVVTIIGAAGYIGGVLK